MAMANNGSASNDATGSTFIKNQLRKKIIKLNDELDRLGDLCLDKPDDHPIFLTVKRFESEIEQYERTLAAM